MATDPATPPAESLFDPEELEFLTELNIYRVSLGLPPVSPSLVLTRAAQAHSGDMATAGFFSHTGSDGSDLGTRVGCETSLRRNLGEILAMGVSGGHEAFEAWMKSDDHHKIMIKKELVQIGIARASDAQGQEYWTADFGGVPIT